MEELHKAHSAIANASASTVSTVTTVKMESPAQLVLMAKSV